MAALCLALGSAAGVAGQEVGVRFGISSYDMSGDAASPASRPVRAFAGGGFIRFGIGPVGFQPEALVTTRGAEFVAEDGTALGRLTLRYVEVPLLLHLPLGAGLPLTPFALGGPTLGFEVGCSADAGPAVAGCADQLFVRRVRDFGFTAGGGVATLLGPGILTAEGRYTWGSTDVNRATGGRQARHRGAIISFGFALPVGGRL